MRRIYLDYNATTPIAPSVQEAMLPFLAEHFGDSSSDHALGLAAREAIEDARDAVARLIGAEGEEIVFTSGGTESNNLAILGALAANGASPGRGHLVVSAVEHPSVSAAAAAAARAGFEVTVAPCDRNAVVSVDAIAEALRPDTVLVSVAHANHEVGVLQPIERVGALCRERNVLFHCDAAQSCGKARVAVGEMHVDLLSLAGHKFYAPKGIGALFVRNGVAIEPVLHGAAREGGLRPGVENTPAIVGLGKAAALGHRCLDEARERLTMLRDRFIEQLREATDQPLRVLGEQAPRLPNTLAVCFPKVNGRDLLARCPELCASAGVGYRGDDAHQGTLAAMGLAPEQARGVLRLSVGWYTSEEDVAAAVGLLAQAWRDLL